MTTTTIKKGDRVKVTGSQGQFMGGSSFTVQSNPVTDASGFESVTIISNGTGKRFYNFSTKALDLFNSDRVAA